jgi:hypothetical protein
MTDFSYDFFKPRINLEASNIGLAQRSSKRRFGSGITFSSGRVARPRAQIVSLLRVRESGEPLFPGEFSDFDYSQDFCAKRIPHH